VCPSHNPASVLCNERYWGGRGGCKFRNVLVVYSQWTEVVVELLKLH
jgi:hypothetical protein